MSRTELQQHIDPSSAPWLRTQLFFEELAAETRKPHFGQQAREWVQALLVRAEEAGLYQPNMLERQ
jgi:hypothetical protein